METPNVANSKLNIITALYWLSPPAINVLFVQNNETLTTYTDSHTKVIHIPTSIHLLHE